MSESHVEHHHHKLKVPSAHSWRSSDTLIIFTMSLALFTDELLFAFMIPLLPTVLEQRIGLDSSLTQRYTSIFLTEGALVSMLASPLIGSVADAVSSKKVLLLALFVLALGSIACLSLTTTLMWLFIGRFFQCIVSQAMWIVGMTTMAQNIGTEHMGKIAGLSSTLTAAGTTAGPLLSGLLFGAGGYWWAWSGAAMFLLLDIIMRLIMKEKPIESSPLGIREREPLLNGHPNGESINSVERETDQPVALHTEARGWQFYLCLFREPRFCAGLFCAYVFAVLVGSLESTMAVHVRSVFGWTALHVGLLLGLMQGPGILLAAPVGWMKDKVGSRIPSAVGFILLTPVIIFSGAIGDDRFRFLFLHTEGAGVSASAWEKNLFVACIAAVGCLMSLLSGVGSIETTETIDKLEALEPGKFGSNGGYSRGLAVTGMTWMAGLMTGPLMAELVLESLSLGYLELQCCLALLSFAAGVTSVIFLGGQRGRTERDRVDREGGKRTYYF